MWPPDLITTGERPSLSNVDSTDTDERTLRYQFYSFQQLMSRTTSVQIIRQDASVAFGRARCITSLSDGSAPAVFIPFGVLGLDHGSWIPGFAVRPLRQHSWPEMPARGRFPGSAGPSAGPAGVPVNHFLDPCIGARECRASGSIFRVLVAGAWLPSRRSVLHPLRLVVCAWLCVHDRYRCVDVATDTRSQEFVCYCSYF